MTDTSEVNKASLLFVCSKTSSFATSDGGWAGVRGTTASDTSSRRASPGWQKQEKVEEIEGEKREEGEEKGEEDIRELVRQSP